MKIYNIKISSVGNFFKRKKNSNRILQSKTHKIIDITKKDVQKEHLILNQNWHETKYGFKLPKNEVMIFKMHRKAWELFYSSEENYCLIIQDNVHIEKQITEEEMYTDLSGKDWDVLFPFEESSILNQDELSKIKILNENTKENKDYDPYLLGKEWYSSIYFLSKAGCKSLLKIKEISQTVIDEILLRSIETKITIFCKSYPWFDYKKQPKILNLEREEEIYTSLYKNNIWKGYALTLIKKILSILSKHAKDLKIDLILQGGTHLGFVQHGGLMPWDDDVDIGIRFDHLEKLLSQLRYEPYLRISEHIEESSKKIFYKIWSTKGEPIPLKDYTFPFVDLWLYKIVNDDLIFLNGIICPNANKKKLKKIMFEGAEFKIPSNSVECFDARYKTWKSLIRVYQWSHRKETAHYHPLKLHIKTNKKGNMISPMFKVLQSDTSVIN